MADPMKLTPSERETFIRVWRLNEHALAAVEAILRERGEDATASWECLMMVRETLEALGTPMEASAPMFYPEAIRATLYRWCKRALAGELVEQDGKCG